MAFWNTPNKQPATQPKTSIWQKAKSWLDQQKQKQTQPTTQVNRNIYGGSAAAKPQTQGYQTPTTASWNQSQGRAPAQQKPGSWAAQMANVYNPKTNPALMDPRINSQAAIEQGKKAGYTPVTVDSYYGQAKPDQTNANQAWANRYQKYWESQFKPYVDNPTAWANMGANYRGKATEDWVSTTRRNRAWTNRYSAAAAEYWGRPTEPLPEEAAPAAGGGGGYGGGGYGYDDYGYGGVGGYGGGGYEPVNNWYANMVQWSINKPTPG